ncbi:MAG: hypothetical protein ACRD3E_11875, partial [Terriglobales bacterium]
MTAEVPQERSLVIQDQPLGNNGAKSFESRRDASLVAQDAMLGLVESRRDASLVAQDAMLGLVESRR